VFSSQVLIVFVLQSEPSLIPSNKARHQLVEKLLFHAKGAFESALLPSGGQEDGFEDMDMEEEEGQLLPVCTY